MRRLLKKWIRNERGVALIEFAIVFPFMFLMLFGAVEVGRYILIVEKVEKSAYALTNLVTTLSPATIPQAAGQINVTQLNNVFLQFDRMMSPYNGNLGNEAVIFTSIVHHNGQNLLRWQVGSATGGGGTMGVNSIVNGASSGVSTGHTVGGPCTPVTFADADVAAQLTGALEGENFIIGEVFYKYQPIVTSLLPTTTADSKTPFSIATQTVSRRFFLYPRNGDLIDLPPIAPVAVNSSQENCP